MRRLPAALLSLLGVVPGAIGAALPGIRSLDPTAVPHVDVPPLPAELRVVEYGPKGDLEGRDAPTIRVLFNQAVVSNIEPGGTPAGTLLRLDPPIPGRSVWRAPDLLVFEPEAALPVARLFRVTLVSPISGLQGRRHDAPLSWTFETKRPVIDRWSVADDGLLAPDEPVTLQFSVPVALEKLRQALRVESRGGAQPFTLESAPAADVGENKILVRPGANWPTRTTLTISVSPAVLTPGGNLPMRGAWQRSFRVLPALGIENLSCGEVPGPLRLALSTPIPRDQQTRIRIEPALSLQEDPPDPDSAARWGGKHVRILTAAGARADVTYRITLPADLTDVFGQKLASPSVREIHCGWPRPGLALATPSGVIEAVKARTIGVESRGVDRFILRAVILDARALAHLRWPLGDNDFLPAAHSLGLPVIQRVIALRPEGPTRWSSVAVDLGELTKQARRPILVEVEPVSVLAPAPRDAIPDRRRALYQVSDLGIVAFHSVGRCLLRVAALSTGAPVAGALVFESTAQTPFVVRGKSDASGLVLLDGRPATGVADGDPLFLVKTADGQDMAVLRAFPAPAFYEPKEPLRLRAGESIVGTLVPNRDLYAPGQTAHVVGYLAIASPFATGGQRPVPPGMPVALRLRQGNTTTVAETFVSVQAAGKFWADVTVPPQAALGWYSLDAQVGRAGVQDHEAYLGQRWEYVGPQTVRVAATQAASLIVNASVDKENVLADNPVHITIDAQNATGGPARLTAAHYQITCEASLRGKAPPDPSVAIPVDTEGARRGHLAVEVKAPWWDDAGPTYCTLGLGLRDAAFRDAAANISFTVHPGPVALRVDVRPRTDLRVGQPGMIVLRALSHDETPVVVPNVALSLRGPRGVVARWSATLKSAGADFAIPLPHLAVGRYELMATAPTSKPGATPGPHAVSASIEILETMVSGVVGLDRFHEPVLRRPPAGTGVLKLAVPLHAQAGQTVTAVITGPARPLQGLVIVTRGNFRQALPFTLQNGQAHMDLHPTDAWMPEAEVQVVAVVPSTDGPARLTGDAALLTVSSPLRRLVVDLTVPERARPGEEIPVAVHVSGPTGAPEGGTVTVWAVDERNLALTDYAFADLASTFVARPEPTAVDHDLADIVPRFRARPVDPHTPLTPPLHWTDVPAQSTTGPWGKPRALPVTAGTDPGAAPFRADVALAADGSARVALRLPHAVSQYRIFALASAPLPGVLVPGRFGVGQATVGTTQPLAVQAQAPAQLRAGDETEIAAVLVSDAHAAGAVTVKARLEGAGADDTARIVSATVVHTSMGRGDSRRVTFRLRARNPGQVNLRFEAQLRPGNPGSPLDSVVVPLTVAAPPRQRRYIAVHGSLESTPEVTVPVRLPMGGWQNGPEDRIEVELAPSLASSLEGAVKEIIAPGPDCLELVASRLVPLLTFPALAKAALGERDARQFAREQLSEMLAFALPETDGSAHWRGGRQPDPYGNAFAALVTQQAREAGYFPEDRNPNDGRYLELLVEEPSWLDGQPRATDAVKAMALFALARLDRWQDETGARLDELYINRRALPLAAKAFLMMALQRHAPRDARVALLQGEVQQAVTETETGIAHVAGPPQPINGYVSSSAAFTEAVVLWSLARTQWGSPVVAALARGLHERRDGAAWGNAHDGALALIALAEAARTLPVTVGLALSAQSFVGATPLQPSVLFRDAVDPVRAAALPLSRLPASFFLGATVRVASAAAVTIKRSGIGRLFYGVSVSQAASEGPTTADQPLTLERRFRTARGPVATGEAVRPGEILALDIVVTARAPLRHLALQIPLPAGLEALSANGETTGEDVPVAARAAWWVSHAQQHADRLMLFADTLPPGQHTHSILLRAPVPGRYQLPAARATGTYTPYVNASTQAGLFIVAASPGPRPGTAGH